MTNTIYYPVYIDHDNKEIKIFKTKRSHKKDELSFFEMINYYVGYKRILIGF